MMLSAAAAGRLIDGLAAEGYAVGEDVIAPAMCETLAAEALALAHDPTAIDAGVGRGETRIDDAGIRRARIRWLDGATDAQRHMLAIAGELRDRLNRDLFLGVQRFEAQFALTPEGGYYRRHLDSFKGARNRVVSLVLYLNTDWMAADGGALRLWAATGPEAEKSIDIIPRAGRLVLMLSEQVPHEVLPTHRARASIAGWFRIDTGLLPE